jgi:biotin synthase-related radical SAM superfamily protein
MKIEKARELMQLRESGLGSLFDEARAVKEKLTGKVVNFYFTGDSFPAISVTGSSCALGCKHCGRNMLDGVHHAQTREEIVEMAKGFEKAGAKGCLITGGCRPDGSVPVDEYLDAIETIKKETSLFLLAHTGIIDGEAARGLAKAGLDGVSLDIVGNLKTAKKVYGIGIGPEKYRESLLALEEAGFDVISPHVCVGLDFGKVSHEIEALEIISSIKPTTIEIIGLMPLKGTPMENKKPKPTDIARIIAIAQLMFPKTPIILGCAHSKGNDRAKIEELALLAGASSIALPAPKTEKVAGGMGYTVKKIKTCCAIPERKKEKIRVSVGTANQIGLRPYKSKIKMETAYLLTHADGHCSANCQFCAQARKSDASLLRVARGVYPEFPLSDAMSRLKDAVSGGSVKRVCLQTVNRPDVMKNLDSLVSSLLDTGAQISLSMHPQTREELVHLKNLGVPQITIPLDAVTEELFDRIKGKDVNNNYRWDDHWTGLQRALEVFGKGRVGTHVILGFGETEKEALFTIDRLLEMGVSVGLFAFVPIKGTPLEGMPKPSVEAYRRVQLGYYLLRRGIAGLTDFEFNGGAVEGFGIAKDMLLKIVETGEPFVTAGCPNCNRPYSTESPQGPVYNFAELPSSSDVEEIKEQLGLK